MLIKREYPAPECDFCQGDKAEFAFIAQGATGRWCEVMWVCSACCEDGGNNAMPVDKAREMADNNGYADF